MTPDSIQALGDAGGQSLQITFQIAVAVGFKDQVLRVEVLFTGGRAYVDHIVHDDEAAEMGSRSECKGTFFPGRQCGEVLANLKVVGGSGALIVDDGGEDRQSVDVAVFVWHDCFL